MENTRSAAPATTTARRPTASPLPTVNNMRAHQWSSGVFDCFYDTNSCWWSVWCPCLVFTRTMAQFDLAPSCPHAIKILLTIFVATVAGVITGDPGIALLLFVITWGGLAAWRAYYRRRLKARLEIQSGSAMEDCCVHLCCLPCAVAQEARQARDMGLPPIEFCTGEPLSQAAEPPALAGFRLSRCSQLIVTFAGILFLIAIINNTKHMENVLILLLSLLEPIFILWLVYWRKNRKEMSVDNIIKLFALGFFWTSNFAAVLESILETVLALMVGLAGVLSQAEEVEEKGMDDGELKKWVRAHIFSSLVGMFLLAFLVAACVEETVKLLSVRYCTMAGGPLRTPQAILIALVSVALGFSCAENIGYVFGFKSAMKGVSALVGELYVLGLRSLMPVHVICAALQAIQYIKESIEGQRLGLPGILYPAIILHGTFDFLLMAMAVLQFAYDLNEAAMDAVSLCFGIGLTIVSLIYVMRIWKEQQQRLLVGWQRVEEVDNTTGNYLQNDLSYSPSDQEML